MGIGSSRKKKNSNNQNINNNPSTSLAITDNSLINSKNHCCITCESCTGPPKIYEIENERIIEQNCEKCIQGYNFLFGTNDCYNSSIKEYGFYLSSNDSMYHECDIQCKTCEDNIESNEPNCTLCNDEQGYFPAQNKSSSKCYNRSTIDENYYLSESQNKIWMICYESCGSCYGYGNSSYHNCSSCKKDYYFINNTTNCITEEFGKNYGFYLDSSNNTFLKCDKACSKCQKGNENNNTNCIECNLKDQFYHLYESNSNCFNNETIYNGFYLDKIDTQYNWKKCYERCEICTSGGNSSNMNCLSCKNNLMNNLTSKLYYLKLDNGNCIEYCPNNLYLTSIGDCVEACPNNTYSFSSNHTCLNACPQNYEKDEDNKKCIVKKFDISTPKNEFKNQILNNITEFVNSGKIVNGSDFIATISYSDNMNPEEQIKNGKSAVDLGNCTQAIKNHYNILLPI